MGEDALHRFGELDESKSQQKDRLLACCVVAPEVCLVNKNQSLWSHKICCLIVHQSLVIQLCSEHSGSRSSLCYISVMDCSQCNSSDSVYAHHKSSGC